MEEAILGELEGGLIVDALYDVFQEKEYGAFCFDNTGYIWIGYVGNKKCGSLEEFENLIRPYMEE